MLPPPFRALPQESKRGRVMATNVRDTVPSGWPDEPVGCWPNPEPCGPRQKRDAEIARLRADQTKYYQNLTEIAQQHVKDLDRLRAELAAVREDRIAAVNRLNDLRGDLLARDAELAAARQEIHDKSLLIDVVHQEMDTARQDAVGMKEALTIIADWDRAPITGEWRESLLDIIRSICDCARAAIQGAAATSSSMLRRRADELAEWAMAEKGAIDDAAE
jgi:hypothetical protein